MNATKYQLCNYEIQDFRLHNYEYYSEYNYTISKYHKGADAGRPAPTKLILNQLIRNAELHIHCYRIKKLKCEITHTYMFIIFLIVS